MGSKRTRDWHVLPLADVIVTLNTDTNAGLAPERVRERLKIYGRNELSGKDRFKTLRTILSQFLNPLVLVLLAAGIATYLLGEVVDAIVIASALVVHVAVGIFQEGRSKRVFEKLARSQSPHATVLREGAKKLIAASEVVPGDIVFLEGGNAVVADIRLFEAVELSVNESALTGEWAPVSKTTGEVAKDTPLTERTNMVWNGTSVVTGYGRGIVVATGMRTQFGSIAQHTRDAGYTRTPLQQGIHHLARLLTLAVGCVLVALVAFGLVRGEPLIDLLMIAIAVAVAAIPSGLPAALTIVLALAMESVLRAGGLVRNLLAGETLGSTTIILVDKTGTLTEGAMTVAALYTARGIAKNDATAAHEDNKMLLASAVLASDAFVTKDEEGNPQVHGRPVERAVVIAGLNASLAQPQLFAEGNARLAFLQFQSARRYSASLNEHPQDGMRVYVSGAPEQLLAVSTHYYAGGTVREMDAETRRRYESMQRTEASQGRRLIAVAYRTTAKSEIPRDIVQGKDIETLTFMGLMALSDAVRAGVPQEIARAREAGIRVVMVTGDYAETAAAVAVEAGITKHGITPITGEEIAKMNDEALLAALARTAVFARVLPEQKLRIVRALKSTGEVVAMTGDGINDAPALVSADIGVAVGSGTDVAKEASDLVLLNNTFSTITAAIAQGRRAIDNLRKILAYLLSTSMSEVVIIGGALLAGAPLPLLPVQLLWSNLVEEGFMSFPLAFEPPEKGGMKRKPQLHNSKQIITAPIRKLIMTVTLITAVTLLALFYILYTMGIPIERIRTIMFVALSIDAIFFALSFKDLHRPLWRIPVLNNTWLFVGLAGSLILLAAALLLPPLRTMLSLTPLSVTDALLLLALGMVNLATIEVAKYWTRR